MLCTQKDDEIGQAVSGTVADRMKGWRGQSGFTLIELIIVMMIVGFLCLFSFPSINSLQASLLRRAGAREVSSMVRLAKAEAVRRGELVRITFDTFNHRILLKKGNDPTSIYPLPTNVRLYSTNFPQNRLFFHATGTPSSGGTVTLQAGGRLIYAIIVPVTGRVRISDTPP